MAETPLRAAWSVVHIAAMAVLAVMVACAAAAGADRSRYLGIPFDG
jgi:hypothetical protein